MEIKIVEDIAEIKGRLDGHDGDNARLDDAVKRHDELISGLREAIGRVATKDDILELRRDINQTHAKQMSDALNSVPGKIAAIFTGGGFLVALVALILDWAVKRHG